MGMGWSKTDVDKSSVFFSQFFASFTEFFSRKASSSLLSKHQTIGVRKGFHFGADTCQFQRMNPFYLTWKGIQERHLMRCSQARLINDPVHSKCDHKRVIHLL